MDQILTDEQRKAFANLIREQQKRDESSFGDFLKSLKDAFTPKFDRGTKVRTAMDQLRYLRGKLTEVADTLRQNGFRVVDDGIVSVDYDVSNAPFNDFEKTRLKAQEEHAANEEAYRKGILEIWSARTQDEARAIVQRLLQ